MQRTFSPVIVILLARICCMMPLGEPRLNDIASEDHLAGGKSFDVATLFNTPKSSNHMSDFSNGLPLTNRVIDNVETNEDVEIIKAKETLGTNPPREKCSICFKWFAKEFTTPANDMRMTRLTTRLPFTTRKSV